MIRFLRRRGGGGKNYMLFCCSSFIFLFSTDCPFLQVLEFCVKLFKGPGPTRVDVNSN